MNARNIFFLSSSNYIENVIILLSKGIIGSSRFWDYLTLRPEPIGFVRDLYIYVESYCSRLYVLVALGSWWLLLPSLKRSPTETFLFDLYMPRSNVIRDEKWDFWPELYLWSEISLKNLWIHKHFGWNLGQSSTYYLNIIPAKSG